MIVAGVDIETSGLEQRLGHRIIEIAILAFDFDTQRLVDRLVVRINPERPIDAKAQEVHGISFLDLVACPKWPEVAQEVARIMSSVDLCVAHNTGFDAPFIGLELMRVGVDVPDVPFFDTMDARWATPLGKNPNLSELCFALDVNYDKSKAHRAEYDVLVMMKAFFNGCKLGVFKPSFADKKLKQAA